MKLFVCILAIVAIIEAVSDTHSWENFKFTFSKNYRNIAEEKHRYNIFLSNMLKIREHNEKFERGQSSFEMGVNKFTDLTPEEFLERMKYSKNAKPEFVTKKVEFDFDGDLPTEVDWTKKGVVTEVKDQGGCGSCWAFSTTGAVESQHAIKTGQLYSFSEQQLVDCASDNCFGCEGGLMDKAMEYIVEAGGIMLEKDYPYEAQDGKCRYNESLNVAKLDSFAPVDINNEFALRHAVAAIGPVSSGICVSESFMYYKSGVLNDDVCGNTKNVLNHGVLVVGYGLENGYDYWLVKNSWGPHWGLNGYIKMARNQNNQCGIATEAVYPIMK